MSPKDTVNSIERLANISSFTDGATYLLPRLRFETPNIFSSVAFFDSLVVKIPTGALLEDFARLVKRGVHPTNPTVRLADAEEKDVDTLIGRFPEFRTAYRQHADHAHLLMVHRRQYERIKGAGSLQIPQSRFILVRQSRFWFLRTLCPAIVQERVRGTPLLEIYTSAKFCYHVLTE